MKVPLNAVNPNPTSSAIRTTPVKPSSTPETRPARFQKGANVLGEVSMESRVTTPTAENTTKESPPFRWNMPGSRGIMSRNETGLNVEDSDRWLDHR